MFPGGKENTLGEKKDSGMGGIGGKQGSEYDRGEKKQRLESERFPQWKKGKTSSTYPALVIFRDAAKKGETYSNLPFQRDLDKHLGVISLGRGKAKGDDASIVFMVGNGIR